MNELVIERIRTQWRENKETKARLSKRPIEMVAYLGTPVDTSTKIEAQWEDLTPCSHSKWHQYAAVWISVTVLGDPAWVVK
jgi:hypothetical protein